MGNPVRIDLTNNYISRTNFGIRNQREGEETSRDEKILKSESSNGRKAVAGCAIECLRLGRCFCFHDSIGFDYLKTTS